MCRYDDGTHLALMLVPKIKEQRDPERIVEQTVAASVTQSTDQTVAVVTP